MLTLSLFTKMEQKCNIGGGSLRNRHVVKEDRISDLPEALLLHILSSLSTKEVIATSVLSKRWRSLWKLVSKLTFESEIDHMSSEDVYRSLILHKAPFLERLHLNIGDKNGRLDIGILIGIAFARDVRELVVDLYHDDQKKIRFPSVLCSYNNTLEVLELMNHVLLDFPSRVCLNSLRELQLHEVVLKDEESVCNLLSGCLSLEVLVLTRLSNWNVKTYTIAVPSLKRLTIEEASNQDVSGGGYDINAPSLQYLNIKGFIFLDFCLIENAPELVEAKLNDVSDITNENILASLTSAKSLSLHLPLTIKCPAGSIFYQLVSLELCINWWNLLSFMLENSPKLQNLKLIKQYSSADQESPVDWRKWNEPRCVPECLLLHLETFVWTRYEWEGEDEKQVATYILKNATRLKKATISTKDIYRDDLEKLEKRRVEMLNELASVVRSSNSCHLVFESELSLELSLSCFG